MPNLLVALYDPAYLEKLTANFAISAVITSEELAGRVPDHLGLGVATDAVTAFYAVHDHLLDATDFYGALHPSAVSPDASVDPHAHVAPQGVDIGPGCRVEAGAVVLERSTLGAGVVIRANAVIGGEGFEPKDVAGRRVIIRHAGGVRLGDRVEIQAGSHVARAVLGGVTEIGEDTKIDALVQVAHNVRIGKRCKIAGCACIAGSTTIGDDVWIGPGAMISSEVTVGFKAFVAIGSLVLKAVPPGGLVWGSPAKFVAWREGFDPSGQEPASS